MLLTPQQYKDGYWEMVGMLAYQRKYIAIGQTRQGNYIVVNPQLGKPGQHPSIVAMREGRIDQLI